MCLLTGADGGYEVRGRCVEAWQSNFFIRGPLGILLSLAVFFRWLLRVVFLLQNNLFFSFLLGGSESCFWIFLFVAAPLFWSSLRWQSASVGEVIA